MIWLIGNKGMLGAELASLLDAERIPYTGTDREVDITDPSAIAAAIEAAVSPVFPAAASAPSSVKRESVRWIVNCAAYTAVDRAEDEKEHCRLLNTAGAGNVAAAANKTGARLIHISTDYVFNGRGAKPYTEDDATDPIGVYGLTKRDGEVRVLEENARSYIIRTAWLYGAHGNNFVHTMLRLMKERGEVRVVNDQRGSPTWAFDLARAVLAFIKAAESGRDIPFGVYNYTNEGNITWFDFAREIYAQGRALGILTKDCEVKPCASADFPAKVNRPAYSVLDKAKIKTTLEIYVPAWDKSLRDFLCESTLR